MNTTSVISKLIEESEKGGAEIHGNIADFGCGSVIEFSIENGQIKFDGGLSFGVEFYDTVEEALEALACPCGCPC